MDGQLLLEEAFWAKEQARIQQAADRAWLETQRVPQATVQGFDAELGQYRVSDRNGSRFVQAHTNGALRPGDSVTAGRGYALGMPAVAGPKPQERRRRAIQPKFSIAFLYIKNYNEIWLQNSAGKILLKTISTNYIDTGYSESFGVSASNNQVQSDEKPYTFSEVYYRDNQLVIQNGRDPTSNDSFIYARNRITGTLTYAVSSGNGGSTQLQWGDFLSGRIARATSNDPSISFDSSLFIVDTRIALQAGSPVGGQTVTGTASINVSMGDAFRCYMINAGKYQVVGVESGLVNPNKVFGRVDYFIVKGKTIQVATTADVADLTPDPKDWKFNRMSQDYRFGGSVDPYFFYYGNGSANLSKGVLLSSNFSERLLQDSVKVSLDVYAYNPSTGQGSKVGKLKGISSIGSDPTIALLETSIAYL